ncbi:MAG: hypothetical protein M3552_14530, partial [Planctomycetota bacterium]|nr:hypothetical protein [Planctomycetota bacterium]
MVRCGRSWATCLTAVLAAATAGPLAAAPFSSSRETGSAGSDEKPLIVPAPSRAKEKPFAGFERASLTSTAAPQRAPAQDSTSPTG